MTTRRRFLGGLAALGCSRGALADDKPPAACPAPHHYERIDRQWKKLGDLRESGFVSYYAESFPFRQRLAPGVLPPDETSFQQDVYAATCDAGDWRPLYRRPRRLVKAILSEQPSETCLHVGDEPVRIMKGLVDELRAQVEAACADPEAVLVPVGSHHSCSGAYRPPGFEKAVAIDVGGINLVHPLDERHVLCGAGITICQLNETLASLGLALPTMGSFDAQTLAGACATGTHGSAAHVGAVSDAVVAMLVLATPQRAGAPERWEVLQIQAHEDDVALQPLADRRIADPDLFDAFVVSCGLLGIVVAMVIEVRPAFYLLRRRYGRRWREVREEVAALALQPPAGIRGRGWRYEIAMNPVAARKAFSHPLNEPTPGSTGAPEWMCQELLIDEWDGDLDEISQILRLSGFNKALAPLQEEFDIRTFRPSNEISRQFFDEEGGVFVDRSYRVLRLEWTDSVRAWGTEWFVPLEHGADAVQWVLDRNLQLGYGHEDRLVNPFAVRFVQSRRGLICPSRLPDGGFTCAIEPSVPVARSEKKNARQRDVMVRWCEAFLRASDERGWGARQHWGLVNDPFDEARLQACYPEADLWREAFLLFDRGGRFDTVLARQLGLVAWRDARRDTPSAFEDRPGVCP